MISATTQIKQLNVRQRDNHWSSMRPRHGRRWRPLSVQGNIKFTMCKSSQNLQAAIHAKQPYFPHDNVKRNNLWHSQPSASPIRAGPRTIKTKHFNNSRLNGVKQPITCDHATAGQSQDQICINRFQDLVCLNGLKSNYKINQITKDHRSWCRFDILEKVGK